MGRKPNPLRIKGVRIEGVQADSERWRRLLHSRLWLGLPILAVLSFVVQFLLLRLGDDASVGRAMAKAAWFTLLAACGWGVGIWTSTGREEPEDDRKEYSPGMRFLRRIIGVAVLLGVMALICAGEIEEMVCGEVSMAYGFSGILLKTTVVAAVVIPVWLERRVS